MRILAQRMETYIYSEFCPPSQESGELYEHPEFPAMPSTVVALFRCTESDTLLLLH